MKNGIRCNYIPNMNILTPKRRSHSASSAFNVKKGIRRNHTSNMKALAQVLMKVKWQLAIKG